jgi:hypothetical protein
MYMKLHAIGQLFSKLLIISSDINYVAYYLNEGYSNLNP